jgi:phage tail sheath protein FI
MAAADRLCLILPSPRGPQLLSDVTFTQQSGWRAGSVRRLINVVANAARRAGDDFAFEPSGEALWSQVRQRLDELGRQLLAAGALNPDNGPAFAVRCGRDTMTQADIDNGRLIAEIELVPAQPIVRIVVVLALRDAQPVVALRAAA